jgi:hypothetical protein
MTSNLDAHEPARCTAKPPCKITAVSSSLEYLPKILLIGLSLWFIVALIYCIANRIGYKFDLEWLEGEILLNAVRLLEHKSIYAPPSAEFVPNIYPPFYYALVACAFLLFGSSLPVMRAVSAAALFFIFVLIFKAVSKETRSLMLAVVSMGLFAGFYDLHSSWYDIGRVDSVFYFLLLLGIWFASEAGHSKWRAVASAIILSMAVYTKQSAALYIPFVVIFLFTKNRKSALLFSTVFIIVSTLALLILHLMTDGWFTYIVVLNPLDFPRGALHPARILHDITQQFPILLSLAAVALGRLFFQWRKLQTISIWEIMLIPSIIAYVRIKLIVGADANDSIYMTLWLSMLVPLWLGKFVESGNRTTVRKLLSASVMLLLCVHLATQLYSPQKWIPTPESSVKGNEIIQRIKQAQGPVLVDLHPFYAWLAGKQPYQNGGCLWAFNLGKRKYAAEDLLEKIRNRFFSLIVIDDGSFGQIPALIAEFYKVEQHIAYDSNSTFRPLGESNPRPVAFFIPK